MLYAAVPAAEAIEDDELRSRVIAMAAAGNNSGISHMAAKVTIELRWIVRIVIQHDIRSGHPEAQHSANDIGRSMRW